MRGTSLCTVPYFPPSPPFRETRIRVHPFTYFSLPSLPPPPFVGADSGLRELSRVLDGGAPAASSLQHIYLDDCSITGEGVAWLGGALVRGRLSNLESLSLARNDGVGEEGVRYLVKFLEEMGGRCRLNMIDLRWTNMGVGGAGKYINKKCCPSSFLFTFLLCLRPSHFPKLWRQLSYVLFPPSFSLSPHPQMH